MTPGTGDSGVFPAFERRVGKYRLLDLVGRGAMGQVYAAIDDHTGRKVAIKVVNADLEGEPDIRVRFFREAQTAARLVHRNVITIYDLGEDYGSPFIVMATFRSGSTNAALGKARTRSYRLPFPTRTGNVNQIFRRAPSYPERRCSSLTAARKPFTGFR